MKIQMKNKMLGVTGLIAAALFFISGMALARTDMSFLENVSFRMPDQQAGRTVPFVIKGITLYLTSMQAAWTKGLTCMTIAALGVIAMTVFMSGKTAEDERR